MGLSAALVRQLFWVFIAGGLGASLRVAMAGMIDIRLAARFPYVGTLVVNMLGCLAIGVAATVIPPGPTRTAVVGGFLGGFTTYSAFALFSYELLQGGRTGVLALQVGLHLVVGLLSVWGGIMLGRAIVGGASGAG